MAPAQVRPIGQTRTCVVMEPYVIFQRLSRQIKLNSVKELKSMYRDVKTEAPGSGRLDRVGEGGWNRHCGLSCKI